MRVNGISRSFGKIYFKDGAYQALKENGSTDREIEYLRTCKIRGKNGVLYRDNGKYYITVPAFVTRDYCVDCIHLGEKPTALNAINKITNINRYAEI